VRDAPAWSPDGSRIGFVDDRKGSIRVLDLRTHRTTTLWGADAFAPAWSPDGKQIAYRRPAWLQLVPANATHTSTRVLARVSTPGDASFAWSPDGKQIALREHAAVFLLRVSDGQQRELLGRPHGALSDVAWLASGRIVVADNHETQNIAVAQPDGSDRRQLTSGDWFDWYARWSPDSRTIAFVSDRDGRSDQLYLMNADGSGVRRLIDGDAEDDEPSWSPDGSRLAFVSNRGGHWAIWTIGTGGTDARLFAAGQFGEPVWSLDGRSIDYSYTSFTPDIGWRHGGLIARADNGAIICESLSSPFAWSPDSHQLEAYANNGDIDVIDSNCQPVPTPNAAGSPFLWGPDGSGTIPCSPFQYATPSPPYASGCDADWQPLLNENAP
jgi:Tol biopolymer transport system component